MFRTSQCSALRPLHWHLKGMHNLLLLSQYWKKLLNLFPKDAMPKLEYENIFLTLSFVHEAHLYQSYVLLCREKLPLMLSETNLPFCQNFKYDRLDGPGSETENLSSTIPLSYTLAFYLIMVKAMYKWTYMFKTCRTLRSCGYSAGLSILN